MMNNKKIRNSNELDFAIFCIENIAAKLGVDAIDVYKALTKQSYFLYMQNSIFTEGKRLCKFRIQ